MRNAVLINLSVVIILLFAFGGCSLSENIGGDASATPYTGGYDIKATYTDDKVILELSVKEGVFALYKRVGINGRFSGNLAVNDYSKQTKDYTIITLGTGARAEIKRSLIKDGDVISFAAYKLEGSSWDTTKYYTFSYIVKFPDGLTSTTATSTTTTTLKPITTTTAPITTSSSTTSTTTTSSISTTTTTTLKPALDCPSGATCYYVSSSLGNDANSGLSPSTPWKSLEKVSTTTFKPGNFILFKRGDSWYGTLTVTSSGAAGSPITYGAYGTGAKPIITGFTRVSGWVNKGSNIWESTNVVSDLSRVNLVVVDGVNTAMGRTPNLGSYYAIKSAVKDPISIVGDVPMAYDWTGAEAVIRVENWIWNRYDVVDQVGETLLIDHGDYNPYYPDANEGFFIQDDLRTLDQQNEWYYDATSHKLRIYSLAMPQEVLVTSLERVVYLFNKKYVTFDGLAISGANNEDVYLHLADHVVLKDNTITFSGLTCVKIDANSFDSLVDNNVLSDCNHIAISTSGSNLRDVITNNNIDRTFSILGTDSIHSSAAIMAWADYSLIQYNTITNSGYDGIFFSFDNGQIRNNLITDFLMWTGDGGGIYTGGYHENNTLEGNIILRGKGYAGTYPWSRALATGIYLDSNSANTNIIGNTIANCDRGIRLASNTTNNSLIGNLVFNNSNEQVMLSIVSGYGVMHDNSLFSNRLIAAHPMQGTMNLENTYPTGAKGFLKKSDYNHFVRPFGDGYDIFVAEAYIWRRYTLDDWRQEFGLDSNSKSSPVFFEQNKFNSYIGDPIYSNPFTNTKGNVWCGNGDQVCKWEWDRTGEHLDGGSLKISFNSSVSSVKSQVIAPINGGVSSRKNYALEFSMQSTKDEHAIGVFLQQRYYPYYSRLTPIVHVNLSSERTENRVLFSAPIDEAEVSIIFEIDARDSNDDLTLWLDNIKLYEADLNVLDPDDHFLFEYNPSKTVKTIKLSGNYIDVTGKAYSGSVNLQPYGSIVLMKV